MRAPTRRFRNALVAAVAAVSALTAFGCNEQSTQLWLKLAHSLSATLPVHKAMVYMDERLQHHSGGTMALDIYPGGQLGSERELIELLQIGSLAMTKVSASPLEGFVPEMKIFNVPYLFRDDEHYKAILDSAIGRELLLAPERVRLRALGYYDAGSRSFYTVDMPIETPEDLRGLKIRVQQRQTAVRMMTRFGGSPTPIAWGELYTALQQGVVDEHTSVPDILLIGKYVWDRLSPEQRGWLQTAVDESVEYQRGLWQEDTRAALAAVQ